jgi:hypothetical protein
MATRAEIEAVLKLKDEMSASLKGAQSSIDKLGDGTQKASKGLLSTEVSFRSLGAAAGVAAGLFAAAGAAVVGAVSASVSSVVSAAGAISDLSAKTALSTDFLQEMAIAGGQVGISMETIGGSATRLQANIGKAGEVTKETADALGALGLKLSDLKALNPEEQFNSVARSIAAIEDPTTQASIAMALFGRSGAELLPLIRSNFEEVTAEARELGLVLDAEVVAAADHMGDRFDVLGGALTATAQQFGGIIVQNEAFQSAVEAVIDLVGQFNQLIIENKDEISAWATAGILVAASAIQVTLSAVGQFVVALGFLGETILQVEKWFVDLSIAMLESPFAKAIPGIEGFRQGLVDLAKGFSDTLASNMEMAEGVQAFGDSIFEASEGVGNFKDSVLEQIAAGDKATESTEKTKKAFSDLGEETGKVNEKIKGLADSIGTGGLVAKMQDLNAAIEMVDQSGGRLSQGGLSQALKMIEELEANGIELTGSLLELDQKFEDFSANALANLPAIKFETDDWNVHLAEAGTLMDELADKADTNLVMHRGQLEEVKTKTIDWGKAMDGVNDILSEARGAMDLFGISADSTFGKIIGWVSKAFDAFNSLTGMIGKISGALGGIGGAGGGLGGILGGVGRLFGIGGGPAAAAASGGLGVAGSFAGSGLSATVGGVGAGTGAATGGGSFLGSIGGLLTNPVTGLIAGIGTAAFFGIKALLKQGNAETTAEFLGIDFDAVSKDLRDRLQTMGEDIGDFATAIQMNIGQIFQEGGIGSPDQFAEKIADTFSFLERGQIDTSQAQNILNDTVQQLIPTIGEMGTEGVAQLERLLAAAEQTGIQFQGLDQLAMSYVQRAQELGMAVNDVVLSGLGMSDALAAATGGGGGTAEVSAEEKAAPFLAAAPEIGAQVGSSVGSIVNPELISMKGELISIKGELMELKAVRAELGAIKGSLDSLPRAFRDSIQIVVASATT